MESSNCSFVEKIGGVTFIVTVKSDEKAKKTTEEFIEELIIKESLALKEEGV